MGEKTFEFGSWVIKYESNSEDIIEIKRYDETDDENNFDFRPLNITPLFLLANGFEFNGYGFSEENITLLFDRETNQYKLLLSIKIAEFICKSLDPEKRKVFENMDDNIKYVHQLQKIFNLLNIDKKLTITDDLNNLN